MAQSALDTKKTAKMITKDQIKATDPEAVFDWEASKVEAALKELSIDIGKSWSKGKKAYELNKAIMEMNAEKKVDSVITGQDSNLMMLQMFQKMQEQMASQIASQMASQMEANSQALAAQMETQSQALASQM